MFHVRDVEVPASERGFHFLSGRVCLDLVATVGERWRRRFERLRTTEDLDRWLRAAGRPARAPASPADLRAARRLREAVERLAVAAIRGHPSPRQAVATLNAFAAHADAPPRLSGRRVTTAPAPVRAHLSAVARDAIDLFGGPLAARVRECASEDCALVYVDTSRSGTRRWCSMTGCGNRSKVARHRTRQGSARKVT